MNLEHYEVHRISYRDAMRVLIENHYLHRSAPASYCFGLFDDYGSLLGVITYGTPASRSLMVGLCGHDEAEHVIELTRLWISDLSPKNAESFLIGRSLRMLPDQFDIVVSYAEVQAGHIGTIYQATNFLYTGLSDRHAEWLIDGVVSSKHRRHLFDEYGGLEEAKRVLGDRLERHERPRKHRYVYFRGSRRRRRELMSKLRYETQPYPTR